LDEHDAAFEFGCFGGICDVPSAERVSDPVRRVRRSLESSSQVDEAALLHRPGRNMEYVQRRGLAGFQDIPSDRKVPLLPPCGIRQMAGTRPYCPEGERFCGIPVWKLAVEQFERVI